MDALEYIHHDKINLITEYLKSKINGNRKPSKNSLFYEIIELSIQVTFFKSGKEFNIRK